MCLADDQTHVLIWKLNYPVSITAIDQPTNKKKIQFLKTKQQMSEFQNESMNNDFILRCTIDQTPSNTIGVL